jgi:hypothetical protein
VGKAGWFSLLRAGLLTVIYDWRRRHEELLTDGQTDHELFHLPASAHVVSDGERPVRFVRRMQDPP